MFWDNVAPVYDIFANIINIRVHRNLCKQVSDLIESEDKVLECACGTGMLTVHIAEKCKSVIATDYSHNMLKRAKNKCRHYKNVRIIKENILSLDFPDNSFDRVVAANVIHLLDEPNIALKEMERVCKIGGQLIIPTYINKAGGEINRFSKAVGKVGADFKNQFTVSKYREFFKKAGYAEVRINVIRGVVPCALAIINL